MENAGYLRVLAFWSGAPGSVIHHRLRAECDSKSDVFDAQIRDLCLGLYERACRHELAGWRVHPLLLLALIIVRDQFPRNMFRDSLRAFESDGIALDGARRMTAMHWNERLNAHERQFAYLPFEHAEQLEAQKASMPYFDRLADACGSQDLLEWSRKHYVIVERFGRFPHRNTVLGREPTPEEIEFLQGPDSRF
jgi:uncharacterized protein (DUF924 family)